MIKCPKCGYENEPVHIFCARCGAKLQLANVTDSELFKSRGSGRRCSKCIVVLVIICCAAATAGLLLWLDYPAAGTLTKSDFHQAYRKINLMEKGAVSGPQIFSEKEVSAYLAAILMRRKRSIDLRHLPSRIRAVHVSIKPDAMRLAMVETLGPVNFGRVKIGPLNISYAITGLPEVGERRLHFSVKGGRTGHLPLPGPLGYIVLSWARPYFFRIKKCLPMIGRIKTMRLGHGKIAVSL